MSDDIAFKIQLGILLPKLKSTIQSDLTTIIEDHIGLIKEGTLEGQEAASIEEIKGLMMQSLEIFLDNIIIPPIEAKMPKPEVAEPEAEASPE